MKKFLSKYKFVWIIGIILICIALIVGLIFLIAPPLKGNNYGHRLDDESKYKVSTSTIDEIKTKIGESDDVKKITYHKEGRILNFTITVEDGVVLGTAKKYAENVISSLDEKNLKYYDIQIFLDGKDDIYPIAGYHAKGTDSISWGNAGVK